MFFCANQWINRSIYVQSINQLIKRMLYISYDFLWYNMNLFSVPSGINDATIGQTVVPRARDSHYSTVTAVCFLTFHPLYLENIWNKYSFLMWHLFFFVRPFFTPIDKSHRECLPLILEPASRFYQDPIVVLDFQSLYPSIHNRIQLLFFYLSRTE